MKYYIYLFVFFLFSCSNHHSLDNVAVKQLPDLGDLTKRMEFYVSLEELRRITGTDKQKTYDKLSNFKNRILDKALREIEECCGVQITYTNHKQGRNIIGFDFVATYLGIDLTDYEPPQKYIDRARRFNLQQEAKRRKLTPEEQAEYDTLCAHAEQIELDFD